MVKWILSSDLAVVESRAQAARDSIPEAHVRKRAEAYASAYGEELARFSQVGALEEVRSRALYAIHRRSVNEARFKRHGWYVDEFDVIPVAEVGRKRNIVYVVDGRLL